MAHPVKSEPFYFRLNARTFPGASVDIGLSQPHKPRSDVQPRWQVPSKKVLVFNDSRRQPVGDFRLKGCSISAMSSFSPNQHDSEVRRQIIADADEAELKARREDALGTMHLLLKAAPLGTKVHPDYAILSAFVGEIEAEQEKRASTSA